MIYMLYNPKANNGKGETEAREWAKCLNEEATYINVLETPNMKEFLSSLNEEDVIIVAGGDGTIHHFANNAVELNLKNKMYYVKSGSGNDFYRDNKEYADELGRIELNRFFENLPRMLKEGMGVSIDIKSFPRPEIFNLIMKTGNIDEREMYNVFNMGIGFVMALEDKDVDRVLNLLSEIGEEAYVIGKVTDSGEVDLVW